MDRHQESTSWIDIRGDNHGSTSGEHIMDKEQYTKKKTSVISFSNVMEFPCTLLLIYHLQCQASWMQIRSCATISCPLSLGQFPLVSHK
ncbi:hypothetical protein DPMN_121984 [Dreissena polymorpha]|uniref:Uncharacterized protein n=1 Tax=Dreissena polymorpha TaxID=45954 RepID=A0A9D4GNI4_DREPO|nr:hypothetical protein DPMN_121984 [Dreissena polymorpha]